MNKFYDKLIFLIALLALGAGVGFYFMKSGEKPADPGQVSVTPADNPYAAVPVPASESTEANWPEPAPQSTGWLYDVFTPPKIYLDPQGRFTAEGYIPPPPPKPFGVYLADISRNLYRIQLEGYIEEQGGEDPKYLLLFYDEERQQSVRARVGQTKSASEFEVLDFNVTRETDELGNIEKTATATIRDTRSGEEIQLVHGEPRYETGVTVVIRSREDPEVDIELSEEGATFSTPSGEYVLEEINLEESSVTVEKLGTEEEEPKTKRLRLDASAEDSTNETEEDSPAETDSESGEDEPFQFMF